jgi:hypothetical protein
MTRKYIHWVVFDPSLDCNKSAFLRGSRFVIERIFCHPSKIWLSVAKLTSPDNYQNLDLDVDCGSTSIRHLNHKPSGLGRGITLEQFERIYGSYVLDTNS